jgi:hypothetical protein
MRMKQPIWILTLALAINLSTAFPARAELVSEEVLEDAITTEAEAVSAEEEVVIVKKRPAVKASAPKRKVILREVVEEEEAPVAVQAAAPAVVAAPVAVSAMEPAAPARKSTGSAIDEGIQNKMDNVRDQFEQALIRQLDKIKITVAEDAPAAPAVMQSAAPTSTTIVQDSVVNTQGAPVSASGSAQDTYISLDKAPIIHDSEEENSSVAEADDGKLEGNVRVAPMVGWTSLGSDNYNIDSRQTLGVALEVDVDKNLTAVVSYAYAKYDVSIQGSNTINNTFLFVNNNTKALEYNQNVFDAGLRYYLLPKKSRFRAFIGGGVGYNKGFLNYDQNTLNTFATDTALLNNGELDDYEVTSFLGTLESGAELQLSKTISVGGSFKYSNILSSRENKPINNNAFVLNGFGQQQNDKDIAGGSIAQDNFYSILANIKISF